MTTSAMCSEWFGRCPSAVSDSPSDSARNSTPWPDGRAVSLRACCSRTASRSSPASGPAWARRSPSRSPAREPTSPSARVPRSACARWRAEVEALGRRAVWRRHRRHRRVTSAGRSWTATLEALGRRRRPGEQRVRPAALQAHRVRDRGDVPHGVRGERPRRAGDGPGGDPGDEGPGRRARSCSSTRCRSGPAR